MQGNDIGTHIGWKHVVILEQTIVTPPEHAPQRVVAGRMFRRSHRTAQVRTEWFESWSINHLMCQWIAHQASVGVGSEIWSFLPEDGYEILSTRINQILDDNVLAWERFASVRDAVTRMNMDTTIEAVYDADYDRIATAWRFRGHAVIAGRTP